MNTRAKVECMLYLPRQQTCLGQLLQGIVSGFGFANELAPQTGYAVAHESRIAAQESQMWAHTLIACSADLHSNKSTPIFAICMFQLGRCLEREQVYRTYARPRKTANLRNAEIKMCS